jgi:hypothetical protein
MRGASLFVCAGRRGWCRKPLRFGHRAVIRAEPAPRRPLGCNATRERCMASHAKIAGRVLMLGWTASIRSASPPAYLLLLKTV